MSDNKSKYVLIILLLSIILIMSSNVSAQNLTTDTLSVDDNTQDIIEDVNDRDVNETSNDNTETNVSSYSELATTINNIKNYDTNQTSHTINLNNGTYDITSRIFWSNSNSIRNLTINGNNQTISGDAISFISISSGYTLNIRNLTISNVKSSYSTFTNNGNLTLDYVTVHDCNSTNGGAIFIQKANLVINNSNFYNNRATKSGGVLYSNDSDFTIDNSHFTNNTAKVGGVILALGDATNKINHSSFINNSANTYDGGVIYAIYPTFKINSSKFINNTANVRGGAIGLVLSGYKTRQTSNIVSSIFENNSASSEASILYSTWSYVKISKSALVGINENLIYSEEDFSTYYDENWWGINNPDFKVVTNNITPNNWILMSYNNTTIIDNTRNITIKLYTLNTGVDYAYTIPTREIIFQTDDGVFSINKTTIRRNVTNTYTGSSENIYATIDYQQIKLTDKLPPYMRVNNTTASSLENKTFDVELNDDATGTITMIFNDNTTTKTVNNKTTQFKKFITEDDIGVNNVTFSYSGDSKYQPCTTTITLKVYDKNTTTTITPNLDNNLINTTIDVLPSSYDLRNLSQVTSVKSQGSSGNCWAYGSIGALETSIIKIFNTTYDLSENNLKNMIKYYSVYGNDDKPNSGSTLYETISEFISWISTVNETDDPIDTSSLFSTKLPNTIKIQDIYINEYNASNNYNRITYDDAKEAIMKYGGLFTSMYYTSSYFNSQTNAYYNNVNRNANHMVCVVGWDDNFNKSNFRTEAPGNGAFIVKNSYGYNYAENGYFYLSYYDTSIGGMCGFILNNSNNYTTIYQHEHISEYLYDEGESIWIKNNYKAVNNETLTAFGTYFFEDCDYTARIYINDQLVHNQTEEITVAGYRTVALTQYYKLTENDNVTIVINITSRLFTTTAAVYQKSGDYRINLKANQSFVSTDGENWIDLYSYTQPGAACLKLYTFTTADMISKYSFEQNYLEINTTVDNLEGNGYIIYMIDGNLLRDSDNNVIRSQIVDNNARLYYENTFVDDIDVKTILITDNYNVTEDKQLIYTEKTATNLSMTVNSTNIYIDDTVLLTFHLQDANANNLYNKTLTITVNNQTYTKTTNSQGLADLRYEITTTSTDITVLFNTTNLYKKSNLTETLKAYKLNQSVTITLNNTHAYVGEAVLALFNFTDANNNPIKHKNVTIIVDNITYNKTTNSQGLTDLKIITNTSRTRVDIISNTTDKYYQKTAYTIINTYKITPSFTITFNNTQAYIGDAVLMTVNFTNDKNEPIRYKNVTITVDNITYNKTTNSQGLTDLKIITNSSKTRIDILFNQTEQYYQKTGYTYLNAYKLTPTVTINFNNTQAYVGEAVLMLVNFTNDKNEPIRYKNVTITVNNITYNKTTNSQGLTDLKIVTNTSKTRIDILFGQTEQYYQKTAYTILNTYKLTPRLNVTFNTQKALIGDTVRVTVNLTDDKNNPVRYKEVQITINNQTYTKTTNSQGLTDLTFNVTSNKTRIDILSTANDTYYQKTGYVYLNALKRNTTITLTTNNTTPSIGNTVKIQACVKDQRGKTVVNGNVLIKIGNTTYNKTTNSQGIATVIYKLVNTTTSVTTTFYSTEAYNCSTKTITIRTS